jgi:hypothetical protein
MPKSILTNNMELVGFDPHIEELEARVLNVRELERGFRSEGRELLEGGIEEITVFNKRLEGYASVLCLDVGSK